MTDRVDPAKTGASLVIAARSGDSGALDILVAEYLPLVYNIVRRTLPSGADVDDVVQDTMVRVVRGISGLREPDRFRSWLVAITVNQIRDHRRNSQIAATRLEQYDDQPDPSAEFVDRALTRLGESQQRREIEHAARWLHSEDRELLSLWSLERSGHLTRADVTDALQLDAHLVAVRVSRLKNRLEAARMLERAFSAFPQCPQLTKAATNWSGEPNPLWRKRFLRHVDICQRCRTAGSDLVPAERLLMGLALLPPPVGYTMRLLSDVHNAAQAAAASAQSSYPIDNAAHLDAKPSGLHHRIADFVAAKPALAVVGVTAVCAMGLVPVVVANLPASGATAALVNTQTTSALPSSTTSMQPTSTTIQSPTAPPRTTTPSPSLRATTAPTTAPTTKAVPSRPRQTLTTQQPPAADPRPARLITLLNERRRTLGLAEITASPDHVKAANDCVQQNLRAGTFEHCGYEVLYKSGGGATAEQMINAWFNSEGHRRALTHPTSRKAGAAIAVNSQGTELIAAINIDY